MILAQEENPPPDTETVEWFLLTTIELGSIEDAEQCLRCRSEDIAHETAERVYGGRLL